MRLAQQGIISINLCICCLSHGTELLKSRHNLLVNVVSPVPARKVSDRYDRQVVEGWMDEWTYRWKVERRDVGKMDDRRIDE